MKSETCKVPVLCCRIKNDAFHTYNESVFEHSIKLAACSDTPTGQQTWTAGSQLTITHANVLNEIKIGLLHLRPECKQPAAWIRGPLQSFPENSLRSLVHKVWIPTQTPDQVYNEQLQTVSGGVPACWKILKLLHLMFSVQRLLHLLNARLNNCQ